MQPADASLAKKTAEGEVPGASPLATPGFAAALTLLACPACLEGLYASADALTCEGCGRLYPVVDGIPILLIDRATLPG